MPVTGSESLGELRSTLADMLQKAEDLSNRDVKGELSPDEVESMRDLDDEIKSYQAAIEKFPKAEGFRDTIASTKTFLRQRATPAPPAAGRTVGGDGGATKGHEGRGGSPLGGHDFAVKSLGELIVEELEAARRGGGDPWRQGVGSQAWGREFKGLWRVDGLGVDNDTLAVEGEGALKATITTSTSPLTGYDRRPGVVELAQRRLTIADLLAQGTTMQPTIRYVRETGFTNAATTVAEGAAKPEASLDLEEVDAAVRKVAVWQKISEEMVMDFDQLRSYIDGRLRYMVLQTEEAQIYGGNGTAPNLRGLVATSGIQTQAQSSGLTAIEAIHKAITKIRATGNDEPDGIVIHPTDWEILRLSQDANDQFYGGGPFYSPYAGSGGYAMNQTVFGLRPVVTTAATAGTALVGAFGTAAQLFRRAGVTVQMTNTDQDDFINNLVTIRAESRIALAVYRPLSFCTVTSLAAGTAA